MLSKRKLLRVPYELHDMGLPGTRFGFLCRTSKSPVEVDCRSRTSSLPCPFCPNGNCVGWNSRLAK